MGFLSCFKRFKIKNSREFLMYFVPSGESEDPSVLRGDSIELKCFWVFWNKTFRKRWKKKKTQIFDVCLGKNDKKKHDQNYFFFANTFFFLQQKKDFFWESSLYTKVYFLYIDESGFGQLVLGLASGLEAFSREPPCDSIGALAARQTPETSGMAREFLSYYP